jgi:hypothetical protein
MKIFSKLKIFSIGMYFFLSMCQANKDTDSREEKMIKCLISVDIVLSKSEDFEKNQAKMNCIYPIIM